MKFFTKFYEYLAKSFSNLTLKLAKTSNQIENSIYFDYFIYTGAIFCVIKSVYFSKKLWKILKFRGRSAKINSKTVLISDGCADNIEIIFKDFADEGYSFILLGDNEKLLKSNIDKLESKNSKKNQYFLINNINNDTYNTLKDKIQYYLNDLAVVVLNNNKQINTYLDVIEDKDLDKAINTNITIKLAVINFIIQNNIKDNLYIVNMIEDKHKFCKHKMLVNKYLNYAANYYLKQFCLKNKSINYSEFIYCKNNENNRNLNILHSLVDKQYNRYYQNKSKMFYYYLFKTLNIDWSICKFTHI